MRKRDFSYRKSIVAVIMTVLVVGMLAGCGSNDDSMSLTDVTGKSVESDDAETYFWGEEETDENVFTDQSGETEDAESTNSEVKESGNVMMSDSSINTSAPYTEKALGGPVNRGSIDTVTFLDTLADMPDDAWDVSANGDGSVMAWVTVKVEDEASGSDKNTYNLFIAGEGGVDANVDCSHLFDHYGSYGSGDLEFNFNNCFYTGNTINMSYMFYSIYAKNKGIDISSFNTSNVTDMSNMFRSCRYIKSINASNIDTSNVTNMSGMFYSCEELSELNINGWDISNVTDMSYMFMYCGQLTNKPFANVDLSDIDTTSMYQGISAR